MHIRVFDLERSELSIRTAVLKLFLKVAIELDRIVLCDDEADLGAVGPKVAQYALGHAVEAAVDESIGYDQTLDEGLEAARYVEIIQLKLQTPSYNVDRREASICHVLSIVPSHVTGRTRRLASQLALRSGEGRSQVG